ncbi:MAG: MBL fold metallo-hydrolase [Oligoflexia bacterium]|nr:MBL fold metallo-hydrolase [Oligoflexia bacterium]
MNTQVGLKQFRNNGCVSYLIYDRQTKETVVIDPDATLLDEYAHFLSHSELKPIWVLDTHIHADHFSATHLFGQEFQSEIGMSHLTQSKRPTKFLKTGDKINFGAHELTVLETPGHTPDSLSFIGDGIVFTGDSLFIGSTGRTDFPGADASQQWESIHKIFEQLPKSTVVLPAHDYNDYLFSTLEVEIQKNAHLLKSKEEFISFKKLESIVASDDEIKKRIEFNLAKNPTPPEVMGECATSCGMPSKDTVSFKNIGPQEYLPVIKEKADGVAFIDVREAEEFEAGHIPGTQNIPMSELGLHLSELRKSTKIYMSCLSGGRSSYTSKTLSYLGFSDVTNISGGFRGWVMTGLPIEK